MDNRLFYIRNKPLVILVFITSKNQLTKQAKKTKTNTKNEQKNDKKPNTPNNTESD